MTPIVSLWPAFVLLAVLGFWMLGAHNRVVALRGVVVAAWAQLDGVLQARDQALAALLAAIDAPLAGERPALDLTRAAQAQVALAATTVRRRPAMREPVAALASAEGAFAGALVRLVALVEQRAGLRAEPAVANALQSLQRLAPRWQFARQAFNEAGEAYNAAITQFPTRLLVPVFRFDAAGRL
ncbi:MAG: LemA family protein [Burkholderiales bacterium]|nr:LemA family protein [Burkholderiales bacterium]